MVTTTYFKIKNRSAIVGVGYMQLTIEGDKQSNFMRTDYVNDGKPDNETNRQISIEKDEYLGLCCAYDLLGRKENEPPQEVTSC